MIPDLLNPETTYTSEALIYRELAWRLLVRLHPCKLCVFQLATQALQDPVFGVGRAELCARCAADRAHREGETWVTREDHIPKILREKP